MDDARRTRPVAFGDYQLEIYLAGLSGTVPVLPMDFATLEARASKALPETVLSYVAGGAGDEQTQRANVAAFRGWGLVPRMFVGATTRDMSTELFGFALGSPVLMAPIGVIGLCHHHGRGDLETAEAAARTGVPMIASTLSMYPMEEVAASMGTTPGFFQLYTPTDRELAESFVRRAEAAGFKAIVITLDTWLPGWRPATCRRATSPCCEDIAWPITHRTRSSGLGSAAHPKTTWRQRWPCGCRSSATP